jgi:hypothetical protein
MTHTLRLLLLTLTAAVSVALTPAAAPALSVDPVGNNGFTNVDPVTVVFGDPSGINSANCMVDGVGPPTSCSSPVSLGGLGEGAHSLSVTAVVIVQGPPCMVYAPPPFADQCVSWTMTPTYPSASVNFTVDRTPPVVSITGGPAEGSSSAATTAAFGISADSGTVTCKLDSAIVACGATADLSGLAVGAHTFEVTAEDEAGNIGSAARSFTVTTPPIGEPAIPKILSAPKSAKVGAKIKLKVSCPDGCRIAVVIKRKGGTIKSSINVAPGATTATFKPKSSVTRKLKSDLKKKRKVVISFTPAGGKSKSVKIKK